MQQDVPIDNPSMLRKVKKRLRERLLKITLTKFCSMVMR